MTPTQRADNKETMTPKQNARTDYNTQIAITFQLKERRDKLLAEYFRAQTAYENACLMAKLIDENVNKDAGGEVFLHMTKHMVV